MGSKNNPTIGYRYLMSLHMGGCRGPVDELLAIQVGGKKAWAGSVTGNTTITIAQPDLFGGDKGEGGIVGSLDVMMGATDQAPNAKLGVLHGVLLPAFRRVMTLLFDGEVCALSPNPQPWKFRVRRVLKGWESDAPWYPEKAAIALTGSDGTAIVAMNPIHILYECRTNRSFGRGQSPAWLDDAAWRAAADRCYSEGLGLCIRWTRTQPVNDFEQIVIDHIAAAMSVDPATGLLSPIMIRNDYDPDALPLFDADSGLVSLESDDSSAQETQPNQIVVSWGDPIIDKVQTVTVSNPAAILSVGGVVSKPVNYVGLPTMELATRIGQRDLQAASSGLHRYKVSLDRRGYKVRPGMPFRVRTDAGTIVLRAGPVTDGSLAAGTITIQAVEDVFGLAADSYVVGQPGAWSPPDHTAVAPTVQAAIELTYRDLARSLSTADLAALAADACYLGTLARRPTPLALNYQVSSQTGSEAYTVRGSGDWCPGGTLAADLNPASTSLTIDGGVDLDLVAVPCAAIVGDEIVRVDALDPVTGIATVARGCVDTVAAGHAAGAEIWLADDFTGTDRREYVPTEMVNAKLLTHTPSANLDPSLAAAIAVTMNQRMDRPYPPGNVTINAEPWPATLGGALDLAWSHRDRLLQADQLVDQSASDIGPEPGTTYTCRIYVDGTLEHEETGIAGTSYSYTPVAASGVCRIELEAVRDALASWQYQSREFNYLAAFAGSRIVSDGSRRVADDGSVRITA